MQYGGDDMEYGTAQRPIIHGKIIPPPMSPPHSPVGKPIYKKCPDGHVVSCNAGTEFCSQEYLNMLCKSGGHHSGGGPMVEADLCIKMQKPLCSLAPMLCKAEPSSEMCSKFMQLCSQN